MKAAIYRWKVAPGDEEYFARRWHEITQDIMRDHGGGGSRLHRAENGDFVAYAQSIALVEAGVRQMTSRSIQISTF